MTDTPFDIELWHVAGCPDLGLPYPNTEHGYTRAGHARHARGTLMQRSA